MTKGELTAKQENFCQAIVSGMSQSDAYRAAYDVGTMKDATIHKRASELMADGAIAGRVAALRAPVIEKMQYGLEQAMQEAEEALNLARSMEKAGQMVAAIQLRAKLNGLLVDTVKLDATVKGAVTYKANMPKRGP